jgi:hypothetical protein
MALLLAAILIVSVGSASAYNEKYKKWTTTQLQEKRIELYKELPYKGNNKGVTAITKWSEPLPQEIAIRDIEEELNLRLTNGDKSAYFEPGAPQYPRKHKNPEG